MKLVLLDENYAETTVRMGPSDDNESTESVSVSVTQDPKLHVFNANGTEVHLIDTPGIGDTGGCDYGRASFDKIIDFIRDYELHGIFILCSRTLVLVRPSSSALRSCWSTSLLELERTSSSASPMHAPHTVAQETRTPPSRSFRISGGRYQTQQGYHALLR